MRGFWPINAICVLRSRLGGDAGRPRRYLAQAAALCLAPLVLAGCDRATEPDNAASAVQNEADAAIPKIVYAFDGEVAAGVRTPRGIIAGDQIIHGGFGSGWQRTAITRRSSKDGTRTVAGDRFSLTIEQGECRRSASNPDRVIARSGPYPFELCGGPRIPIRAVAGTTWQLESLGDQTAPGGDTVAATLTFRRDGKVEGSSGCNDVQSTIRWRQERFSTGGAAIKFETLVPCTDEPADALGKIFWQKFRSARTWVRDDERLSVSFSDGSKASFAFLL